MATTENPLLRDFKFPPYDEIQPNHVTPAIQNLLIKLDEELVELEKTTEATWSKLVVPLEKIIDRLSVVWGIVNHLNSVKDSPQLRAAIEQVQPKKVEFQLKLRQSKPIYNAFKAIRCSSDWDNLSDARKRIVELKLKEAVLYGVSLEDTKRERFNEIEQGYKNATDDSGPWLLTLDGPTYRSVLQHACNRSLREEVFRAHVTRASDGPLNNTPIIESILELRLEKAKLLGHGNYAEVSLETKMATVDKANELIDKLHNASWGPATQDMEDLRDFAKVQGAEETNDLNQWDINFWSERLRESKHNLNEEELRPYFPLPKVMDGLFNLTKKLFEIEIEAANGEAPVRIQV